MPNSVPHTIDGANRAIAEQSLEFGRFRVLLRQRQLLADGVPIELGTRAFELLLALLEADGALVSKEHLLARVWPGVVVAQDNLKTQVFALRRAFGEDCDFIRTEFGRGYRFTAAVRSTVAGSVYPCPIRGWLRPTQSFFSQRITRRSWQGWTVQDRFASRFEPAPSEHAASCRHQTSGVQAVNSLAAIRPCADMASSV
jgi:DNA-binding winged helix-turn-helix (wHTH) protein